jgi:photosystem II stability/assembly factor-like uncharacterized protein
MTILVCFVDMIMKHSARFAFIFSILSLMLFALSGRAQQSNQHTTSSLQQQQSSGWQQVNIGATGALYSVNFINPDTGWIAGGEGVFRTTDHGTTWLPWGPPGGYLKVQFLNANVGWMTTGHVILHTIDGGLNWITEKIGTNSGDVVFLNADTGIVCVASAVSRTTDGGLQWSSSEVDSCCGGLGKIVAFDRSHIEIIGKLDLVNDPPNPPLNVSAHFYSSNAGLTWSRRILKSSHPQLYSGYAFDSLHAIIAGDSSNNHTCIIGITSDGGLSWTFNKQAEFLPVSAWMTSLSTLYLVGASQLIDSAIILCSTNGGVNWVSQNCPARGILDGIAFPAQSDGWAVGNGGVVLHTTNGGFSAGVVQAPLTQNLPIEVYPNPASTAVSFRYNLPTVQSVTLTVYTVSGQFVSSPLNNAVQNPGTQNIALSASSLKSGDYIFLLKSRDYIRTGRFSIVK